MSRVLVTGAAGFIGSHLSERLLAQGRQVVGLDSFSAHYARELKQLNLAGLLAEPGFELVEGDVNDADFGDLVEGVDVVFHLAARPGVRDSWVDFSDYTRANIAGSRHVFDAAAARGARVVYASSSSIYGNAGSLPVMEAMQARPISPYGASKVMTEVLAGAYAASFGLDAIGMRYFTVYGPRQRPDMGLSRFIEAVEAGRPIPLYGDGLQRRDMTYVGDVVEATIAAAERGRSGAVYNVASDAPRTLLDILDQLGTAMGTTIELAREDAKPGDVRDTWGDIGLAAEELGYGPKVTLAEGLAAQVAEASRRRWALASGPGQEALRQAPHQASEPPRAQAA
jgi:UDP-glucuronate 4-epimerase